MTWMMPIIQVIVFETQLVLPIHQIITGSHLSSNHVGAGSGIPGVLNESVSRGVSKEPARQDVMSYQSPLRLLRNFGVRILWLLLHFNRQDACVEIWCAKPSTFLRVGGKSLTAAHTLSSAEITRPRGLVTRVPTVCPLVLQCCGYHRQDACVEIGCTTPTTFRRITPKTLTAAQTVSSTVITRPGGLVTWVPTIFTLVLQRGFLGLILRQDARVEIRCASPTVITRP